MNRIADWELYATPLMRKRGHARLQVFLLHPPRDFAGRAQLDVIAAGRRDEYARVWEAGLRAPLVLAAPIEGEGATARVSADLRLEVTRTVAGGRGRATSSETHMGAISGEAPRHATRIDVVPLLASPDADRARELPRMLRAMRRDAALRVSITGTCPALATGAAGDARELAASGQIEWLMTGSASANDHRTPDSPWPPRTALLATAASLTDIAARLPALPASLSALLLPAGAMNAAEAWPAAARLVHAERAIIVCAPMEAPARDAWRNCFSSRLVGFVDRVLRRAAGMTGTPVEERDLHHLAPGCWLQPLATPADLLALRSLVRDWNRHYASPRLWFATATDYATALEELQLQGHVPLPEITIA
jgi:hypothetical protein